MRIIPYNGTSLPLLGSFNAQIESDKKSTRADFYVAQGSSGSLLSWETSKELQLIDIVREIKSESASQRLVEEYSDLFNGLGKLKNVEVKLHIDKTVVPIAQPYRRIPFHIRKQVEEQLKADEAKGVIERVEGPTPWISPIVVVPKPKAPGQIRVCIDMRRANTAVKRERHATPTINEVVHDLNGAAVYSKIDLNQGYHQLELSPESRYITTFSTHIGLFRYKRLNFGISSAAEVFQNAIRQTLNGLKGTLNISDDILVHGKNQAEHDENLRACFQRLRESGLTLNREKCVFNKGNLKFFGYVFSKSGLSPDPDKIKDIVSMPKPTSASEVRSLLGMANFCSRFIPEYATITEPLRKLTHKSSVWEWTEKQEKSLKQIREALTNAPTLAYFNENHETEIFVDASPVGLGAILTQKSRNGERHTIAYGSRALTAVESRYSQTEREALAVVWACEHFNIYIYGKALKIFTDHKPLVSIYGNPASKPPARIERWTLRLQPYNATIVYRAGNDNPADFLSRHPTRRSTTSREEKIAEEYVNYLSNQSTPKAMTLEEVKLAFQTDETLKAVVQSIRSGKWYKKHATDANINKRAYDAYAKICSELTVNADDDVILRQGRLIIPESLQQRVVQLAHEGHQGLSKTKALIREKVWFPGIDSMVENQVKTCHACQVATPDSRREPLRMSNLPSAPWTEVSADFATISKDVYLLVIIDEYSRYPIVEIISSTSSNTVIPVIDKIFSELGIVTNLKNR